MITDLLNWIQDFDWSLIEKHWELLLSIPAYLAGIWRERQKSGRKMRALALKVLPSLREWCDRVADAAAKESGEANYLLGIGELYKAVGVPQTIADCADELEALGTTGDLIHRSMYSAQWLIENEQRYYRTALGDHNDTELTRKNLGEYASQLNSLRTSLGLAVSRLQTLFPDV